MSLTSIQPARAAPTAPDRQVLFLSGVRGDTRRYRAFHPYEQLQLAGLGGSLAHITDPRLPAQVDQAAVVVFHRVRWDAFVARLFERLRVRGGLAILDTDDLVFDPAAFAWIDSPDFADPVRRALYQEDLRRNRLTLDACQAVTVSTDYLAGQVRRLGRPAWVLRNAFSLEMLECSEAAYQGRPAGDDRVVIGYASGTPTHNRDFELVRPALHELLSRYPQVELHLLGALDPGDWGALAARVRRVPLVPWRELPTWLARFDINLAPLVADNPFSQSKSEIKYVEAGLLRVPTVASPTGAFAYAIRNGENGRLAGSPQEWGQALAELVEDGAYRRSLGEAAYADCLARYHPQARGAELAATLDAIHQALRGQPLWAEGWTEAKPAGSAAFQIDPAFEQRPSSFQMGLYDLRYRGLGTLIQRVWIFFRRLAAPVFPFKPVVKD